LPTFSSHDNNFELTVEILPIGINGQDWFPKETKCPSFCFLLKNPLYPFACRILYANGRNVNNKRWAGLISAQPRWMKKR
jgi:hypothetical protein